MMGPIMASMMMRDLDEVKTLHEAQKMRAESLMIDMILEDMQKTEERKECKDAIEVMRKMKFNADLLSAMRYFGALDVENVPEKDRQDALAALDAIKDILSDFWKNHKRPKGTSWDKRF